jgi:hypothetical protein
VRRVAAFVFLLIVCVAVAAALALAAQSPKSLRGSIFAAARKQRSVHYVENGAAQGLRQTIVADVAPSRGIQKVGFTLQGKKGRFTVIVAGRRAYLRGNTYALDDYLGFTAAQATTYNGRWISVPPGNARYEDLAASVTLPSFLRDVYPRAPLAFASTTIGGHEVTGVQGRNEEPGVRFAQAVFPDSKLRPVRVSDIDASRGFLDAIRISRWNERVRVKAPANAVPITTVLAR